MNEEGAGVDQAISAHLRCTSRECGRIFHYSLKADSCPVCGAQLKRVPATVVA
jgi:rRNA maturation endonuclease Nob1